MSKVTGILNNHHEALRQLATGQPPTEAQRRMNAAARGEQVQAPPLGRTISGLIQENLTDCHALLSVLGVPRSAEGMSLDAGLRGRLLWLSRQNVRIEWRQDDEN